MARKITSLVKDGEEYEFSAEGLEEAVETAQTAKTDANKAVVAAQHVVTKTHELIGGHYIPDFDATKSYKEYDLVYYNKHLWRCTQDRGPGAWSAASFVQTSLYHEIVDMRGADRFETVRVQGSVRGGSGSVVGKKLYITAVEESGENTFEMTFDQDGIAEFVILHDTTYVIGVEDMTGYATPAAITHVANMNVRHVSIIYRALQAGVWVITSLGERIDFALWDTANNYKARLIEFVDSDLAAAGKCLRVLLHRSLPSRKWCRENRQFTSIPNLGNATAATADLDGQENTRKVLQEAEGFVVEYNAANPDAPITVADYVPAFYYASQQSVEIGGETYHAFLPSAGQLVKRKNNQAAINEAIIACGGTAFYVSGGLWWSSSQYKDISAWNLRSGSLSGGSKTYEFQVLPLFDF